MLGLDASKPLPSVGCRRFCLRALLFILGDFYTERVPAVLAPSLRQVPRLDVVTPANTLDDTDIDGIVGREARACTSPCHSVLSCMLQADTVFFFVVELSQQVPHHVATSLVVVGRLARERVVRIIAGGTLGEGACGAHHSRWDTSRVRRGFGCIQPDHFALRFFLCARVEWSGIHNYILVWTHDS